MKAATAGNSSSGRNLNGYQLQVQNDRALRGNLPPKKPGPHQRPRFFSGQIKDASELEWGGSPIRRIDPYFYK